MKRKCIIATQFRIRRFLYFFILLLSFASQLQAQQVKRLYIANDDHTDYMWAGNEAQYDSAFVKMLDFYLNEIDATASNAPDFQARFNCDGSYWLRAYEKYRSPAQFNRLMEAIRSGHISSPLNMLVNCYGAQPAEAVIRGMYYAGQLERKYRLQFTMAGSMENNTLPLGLGSLWAGAGARYSWKGIGGYGSQLSYESRASRRYQLYRYTGPDSSALIMKWYAYNEKKNAPLGGYAECRPVIKAVDTANEIGRMIAKLDAFCDTVSSGSAYPYNIGGAFGWGHDNLDTYVSRPFIEAAKKGTTSTRTVRVSNEEDFFKDVESSYPQLPAESVSFGNEWDLYCASMNETTARVRRAVEKLRSAEALAAVASLKNKQLLNGLTPARNLAWESLGMYWEHNWTADGPVKQNLRADWQIRLQQQLTAYVDTLYNRSARGLSTQINKSRFPSFYVFNPLSWPRNDAADLLYDGAYPVKIVDRATNKEAASQIVVKNGKRFLRIMAENIPPVGYKIYEIRNEPPAASAPAATVVGDYISNKLYRIRLSPSGAITELYDSLAGSRQLVSVTDGKYLNDLGGNSNDNGNTVVTENEGPVSVTIKAVSGDPVLHTVRVTLFANTPRIDIEDSIQANFTDVKTWAFSLGLHNQTTRHEELGAVLTVKKETRGGDYAAQNARYDWQTFNHFADMSEPGYGVTISNEDCSFFKLGKGTVDSLWEESAQLNALAGGRIDKKKEDNGVLGIANQYGQKDFLYTFSMTTHQSGFDAVNAMKFSLEHQTPLVAALITGAGSTPNADPFSLLTISDPDVLLWSVKPAEDGIEKGLVARFWNIGKRNSQPVLTLSDPITQAWKTSHIETDEAVLKTTKGAVRLNFRPYQLNSYRVIPAKHNR